MEKTTLENLILSKVNGVKGPIELAKKNGYDATVMIFFDPKTKKAQSEVKLIPNEEVDDGENDTKADGAVDSAAGSKQSRKKGGKPSAESGESGPDSDSDDADKNESTAQRCAGQR